MMIKILSALVLAMLCLAGCGGSGPETPEEGLQAFVDLFEERDFDTMIRTRYAEIHKAENEEQIQSLIDRYATRFEDDESLQLALMVYESALETAPEMSEDGTVATFKVVNGFIKLSRMPDGKWGFHL